MNTSPNLVPDPDSDLVTPATRRVLNSLSNSGTMIEWYPVVDGEPLDPAFAAATDISTVVVVFYNETAVRITVEAVADPNSLHRED
jgi:hypothetical protein